MNKKNLTLILTMTNFMFISGMVAKLSPTDYVGFTFFVGCMAMMAASAFFFYPEPV
jgi:hypothetical protein